MSNIGGAFPPPPNLNIGGAGAPPAPPAPTSLLNYNFMLARLLGFMLGNRGGLAPKIDST